MRLIRRATRSLSKQTKPRTSGPLFLLRARSVFPFRARSSLTATQIKLLREELKEQYARQAVEIRAVEQLLEERLQELLSEAVKARVFDAIRETVAECVEEKVREQVGQVLDGGTAARSLWQLYAQIPQELRDQGATHARQLLDVQTSLHNSCVAHGSPLSSG